MASEIHLSVNVAWWVKWYLAGVAFFAKWFGCSVDFDKVHGTVMRGICIDTSKAVHVPDEWLTWPGKERGEPRPRIIWAEPCKAEFRDVTPPSKKQEGCRRRLAHGQWWAFCGETDMGQTLPALCTECGGEFRLGGVR